MIKIIRLKDKTSMVVYEKNKAWYCLNDDELIDYAINTLFILPREFEHCMTEMIRNKHNYAEFNVARTFYFSEKKDY